MEEVLDEIEVNKYPVYKDSAIKSIGNIPDHWDTARLASLLINVSERNRPDLPLLSITREKGVILRDLDNEEENHNYIPDDLTNYKVLLSGDFGMNKMKAWQGSYGIAEQDGIVSPAYFIFKLRNDIVPRFFHLAIRSKLYVSFFGAASDGVRIGQWDLSRERMKSIPFLLPPPEEQTAIAQFLDRKTALIDQAISIKEKQIALLKERRQILIHRSVTRGLNPDVKMKDSGVEYLGKIPEAWSYVKFKYIIRTKARLGWKGLKASEYVEHSNFGFLSTPNIKGDDIDFSGAYFITRKRYDESPEIMLQKDDVLLVKDGSTLGIVNIVKELPFYCTVNSSIAVLRIIDPILLYAKYLNYFLKCDYSQKVIELKKDGMGVPHLFQSDINNFIVLLPPILEQRRIVKEIETKTRAIATAISLKQQETEKLREYKSSLINSAVTGKIKVI